MNTSNGIAPHDPSRARLRPDTFVHVAEVRRRAGAEAGLTVKEGDVLALMAEGYSNDRIAWRLRVTSRTVESHINRIFTKLGLEADPATHRRVLAVLAYLRSRAAGDQRVLAARASPTISGVASTAGPIGTSVHDVATVAGGASPTGTVTFRLYANNTCTTHVLTSTNNVVGATATSGPGLAMHRQNGNSPASGRLRSPRPRDRP